MHRERVPRIGPVVLAGRAAWLSPWVERDYENQERLASQTMAAG